MGKTTSVESGTRSRTRQAIVGAAVSVLARDRAAPLADIATAAKVAGSTLHRYFSDRDDLVTAVIAQSYDAVRRAVADAAIGQGPPLEAMRRLIAGMVDAGDQLLFLYGDSTMTDAAEATRESDPVAHSITDLITRGQAGGVFDREIGAAWIQNVLWALVYCGCDAAGKGLLPRHGVTSTVIRTFENGVVPKSPTGRETTQTTKEDDKS